MPTPSAILSDMVKLFLWSLILDDVACDAPVGVVVIDSDGRKLAEEIDWPEADGETVLPIVVNPLT